MGEFIYILINPSLPNMIKIGRTSRSPEERARELSAATAIPTPFIVAYDIKVSNSVLAESLIHSILTEKNYRINNNREFFELPVSEAIKIAHEVCVNINSLEGNKDLQESNDLSSNDGTIELGRELYTKALNLIEYDLSESKISVARKYLLDAIKLGYTDANYLLSELYLWGLGLRADVNEALNLLDQAGRNGNAKAYFRKWEVRSAIAVCDLSTDVTSDHLLDFYYLNIADDEFGKYLELSGQTCDYEIAFMYITAKVKSIGERRLQEIRAQQGLKYSSTAYPGKYSKQMFEICKNECRDILYDMRNARLTGINRSSMANHSKLKHSSMKNVMVFYEFLEENIKDSQELFHFIFSGFDIQDLQFAFSSLPNQSATNYVTKYSRHISFSSQPKIQISATVGSAWTPPIRQSPKIDQPDKSNAGSFFRKLFK